MAKLEALAREKAAGGVEPRTKGYIIFITVFMGLVGLLDQYLSMIEVVATPYIIEEFGVSPVEFAFWQGIYGLITFAVFFVSWFSDAFGRKKGILLLMLILGVAALLIPLTAYSFHWFLILYSIVILGTLSNMWEIPIMEEAPPEKRATYGSIAFLIGLIPLYAVVGVMVAENFGWRWCYGVMFFFMLILVIIWFKMKEPERWKQAHAERQHKTLHVKAALGKLSRKDITYIIAASIVYAIWTIAYKLVITWGGYYYVTVKGLSPEVWNRILLTGAGFLLLGAISSGILMDKLGRKITLVIGCVGSIIGYFGMGLTTSGAGFYFSPIFFWMLFLFMPMILAWIMIYFAEIFPTEIRGTCVGITSTAARASYVLGPLMAALLLLLYLDTNMDGFWIAGGLFMIIPLFSLLLKPYETKGRTLEEIQEQR